MRNSLKIAAVASATALLSMAALSASAVGETALPSEDDRLFVLTCDSEFPFSIGEIDELTGDVTPIGEQLIDSQCWSQGAYNATDGLIYSVEWNYQVEGYYLLSSINPDTGEILEIGPVTDTRDGGSAINQYALAINAEGDAFVVSGDSLFSLDLTTGDATFIGQLNDGVNVQNDFYSLAFNPVTGVLWGLNWSPQDVFTIDITDGSLTLVDDSWNVDSGNQNAGLTFDSNGLAWLQSENVTGMFPADITDIAGTRGVDVGFTYLGENFYAESIVYVPAAPAVAEEEALAETGLADSAATTGLAGLAAITAAAVIARVRRSVR